MLKQAISKMNFLHLGKLFTSLLANFNPSMAEDFNMQSFDKKFSNLFQKGLTFKSRF